MAAGRYLAVNGFADDRDSALYRYNNSNQYVQAINDYAAVLAADPAASRRLPPVGRLLQHDCRRRGPAHRLLRDLAYPRRGLPGDPPAVSR